MAGSCSGGHQVKLECVLLLLLSASMWGQCDVPVFSCALGIRFQSKCV